MAREDVPSKSKLPTLTHVSYHANPMCYRSQLMTFVHYNKCASFVIGCIRLCCLTRMFTSDSIPQIASQYIPRFASQRLPRLAANRTDPLRLPRLEIICIQFQPFNNESNLLRRFASSQNSSEQNTPGLELGPSPLRLVSLRLDGKKSKSLHLYKNNTKMITLKIDFEKAYD